MTKNSIRMPRPEGRGSLLSCRLFERKAVNLVVVATHRNTQVPVTHVVYHRPLCAAGLAHLLEQVDGLLWCELTGRLRQPCVNGVVASAVSKEFVARFSAYEVGRQMPGGIR